MGGVSGGRPGVRSVAGHPSGPQVAADTSIGHRHQPGHVYRTPAVRTAVVPEPADGQSADWFSEPGFVFPFLRLGPACRAATAAGLEWLGCRVTRKRCEEHSSSLRSAYCHIRRSARCLLLLGVVGQAGQLALDRSKAAS